jgi:hypothetical protein
MFQWFLTVFPSVAGEGLEGPEPFAITGTIGTGGIQ